jgi:hypothetical protein
VTAKLWWHRLLVLLRIRKRTLPASSPRDDKKP